MRRTLSAIVLVAAVLFEQAALPSAQGAVLEYRLKAAVLSKLAQFVQWPPAALENRPGAALCVVQPEPFGKDLPDLVAGDTVEGRPLTVMYIAREQDVDACQILYVPPRAPQGAPLLKKATALPILTVGDDPHFLDQGGIVQLKMIEGRVRFEISAAAAARVGIRMSSQLLQLAVAVRGAL